MSAVLADFMADPAEAQGDARRRAALLLHAMTPSDREWVLEALPQSTQEALRPLLAELEDIGIERDARLVDAVIVEAIPDRPRGNTMEAPEINVQERYLLDLDAVDVRRLATLLQTEPIALAASLLAVHAWPWQDALLETFDEPMRRTVREAMAESEMSIKEHAGLRNALVRAVCQRMRAAPDSEVLSGRRPWWLRWRLGAMTLARQLQKPGRLSS